MSEHKKIPVILDGDPGHDDAIAWVLARASRDLGILAVTSCCGNQTIEKTTYNALRVCTLIGLHAPVGKGCPHPLLNDVMNAPSVHGESGLDGPALPEPAFEASALSAPELMAKVLRESPEPVTIVATGPQTNVAALLLAHPELKCKIARISLMGGGIATGNWTPAAEFNILVDPEAARIVFTSGVPITMAGLDVTEKALIMPEDFERVRALGIRSAISLRSGWSFSTSSTAPSATLVRRCTTRARSWRSSIPKFSPSGPCMSRSKQRANTAAARPWAICSASPGTRRMRTC